MKFQLFKCRENSNGLFGYLWGFIIINNLFASYFNVKIDD